MEKGHSLVSKTLQEQLGTQIRTFAEADNYLTKILQRNGISSVATIKPSGPAYYFPATSASTTIAVRQLEDNPAVDQDDVIRMLGELKNDIHMLKSSPPKPPPNQQDPPNPSPRSQQQRNKKTWNVTTVNERVTLNSHVSHGMTQGREKNQTWND